MLPERLLPHAWPIIDRIRLALRLGGRQLDPGNGSLVGELTAREATLSGRVELGRHTYGGFRVNVGAGDDASVHIGSFTSIGSGATFAVGGNHRPDWISTYPFRAAWSLPGAGRDGHPRPESDIVVGNDVWIGAEALILPGVQIGDGAVVGARAVVAKDVRPYAIVVGNPGREIRRRFDDETIEALLAIKWWEWDDETIRSRVNVLCAPDIQALLAFGS